LRRLNFIPLLQDCQQQTKLDLFIMQTISNLISASETRNLELQTHTARRSSSVECRKSNLCQQAAARSSSSTRTAASETLSSSENANHAPKAIFEFNLFRWQRQLFFLYIPHIGNRTHAGVPYIFAQRTMQSAGNRTLIKRMP